MIWVIFIILFCLINVLVLFEIWDWCSIVWLNLLKEVLKLFFILNWWLNVLIIKVLILEISIDGIVEILNIKYKIMIISGIYI